ncbi:MAG: HAD-IIA family hydrolase [Candidatus Limnocylindrales bacterium]
MLLIVDLDGVVYLGPTPIPGMPELLSARVARGDTVAYATNNSRWHRTDYVARLRGMGAPVSEQSIVTAARATALLLAEGPDRPRRVMVFGGPGLARELRDVGLLTVAPTDYGLAAEPDVVVVGVDFALGYRRLSIAAEAVRRGARFVATNRDPVYPGADGLQAGAGAIVAALAVAAGREPDLVVGKPGPRLFEAAADSVGMPVREAVVIGDGLMTDVAAAHAVGARSVLMLTGVSTAAQMADLPAVQRPTAVAHDATELSVILDRFAAHPA